MLVLVPQYHVLGLELDEGLYLGLAAHHGFLLFLQVLLHGVALLVILILNRHHLAEIVGPAPQNLYKFVLQAVRSGYCDLLYVYVVVGLVQIGKGFGRFHYLLFAAHCLLISKFLLLVVPVRQQIVDIVGNNKDAVGCLPLGLVLQKQLPLGTQAVDYASGRVVNEEKLISLLVALLKEADDVNAMGKTGHELGDDVALDDVAL